MLLRELLRQTVLDPARRISLALGSTLLAGTLGLAGRALLAQTPAALSTEDPERSGAQSYEAACAACHGSDGRGSSRERVGFEVPLPDFTDCGFATREADADWLAITREGGPVRAFARQMPAFGDALSTAELQRTLDHIRRFCTDSAWPRGELNLPRALATEKAYPEDEALLTASSTAEGDSAADLEFIWERRIGARGQIELAVPLAYRSGGGSAYTGLGDLAVSGKYTVHHDLEAGRIFSIGAEVVLPTGDQDKGLGTGSTVFEPYFAFGQLLPKDAFIQMQLLAELPADQTLEDEMQLRAALGRTWTRGEFGRAWTPMVELLGIREIGSSEVLLDIVPQCQVTLSKRQHVIASLGVRAPLTHAADRGTQVMMYFLWDWFDGGLREGW